MKSKVKMLIGLILILSLVLTMFGCQEKPDKASDKTSLLEKPKVINISYSLRPVNVPTIVALEKKIFEEEFAKENIEVKWYELEGPATTEALASKSIDFATSLNYVSAMISKANGNDIKVISSYSKFPKAIGLVTGVDTGLNTVLDLKGKKVAVQKGTMLHEMLIKALEEADLKASDIEIVGMASPDALNSLLQKHVDAAVLPDPLMAKAISTKKVKLLRTAEDLILGQAVIAVRTDFAETYPEITKKLLEIHNSTLEWTTANQEEALSIASDVLEMDNKAVKALAPKFDFSLDIQDDNIAKLKESAEFLKTNGFLKPDVDTEALIKELVDTKYLP